MNSICFTYCRKLWDSSLISPIRVISTTLCIYGIGKGYIAPTNPPLSNPSLLSSIQFHGIKPATHYLLHLPFPLYFLPSTFPSPFHVRNILHPRRHHHLERCSRFCIPYIIPSAVKTLPIVDWGDFFGCGIADWRALIDCCAFHEVTFHFVAAKFVFEVLLRAHVFEDRMWWNDEVEGLGSLGRYFGICAKSLKNLVVWEVQW